MLCRRLTLIRERSILCPPEISRGQQSSQTEGPGKVAISKRGSSRKNRFKVLLRDGRHCVPAPLQFVAVGSTAPLPLPCVRVSIADWIESFLDNLVNPFGELQTGDTWCSERGAAPKSRCCFIRNRFNDNVRCFAKCTRMRQVKNRMFLFSNFSGHHAQDRFDV